MKLKNIFILFGFRKFEILIITTFMPSLCSHVFYWRKEISFDITQKVTIGNHGGIYKLFQHIVHVNMFFKLP